MLTFERSVCTKEGSLPIYNKFGHQDAAFCHNMVTGIAKVSFYILTEKSTALNEEKCLRTVHMQCLATWGEGSDRRELRGAGAGLRAWQTLRSPSPLRSVGLRHC